MKNVLVSCVFLLLFFGNTAAKAQQKASNPQVSFYSGSYDELLRDARKQNKEVLLDFWAAWSETSVKLENETFRDPALVAFINHNFLTYKVNVDTFGGMEIANRFSVETFPTLVKLSSRGKLETAWTGFLSAAQLEEQLDDSPARTQAFHTAN